jgi:hypothetical protein
MEDNGKMAQVYELLEQSDFKDLSENDQKFVLSVMSETEYNQMRLTIGNVEAYFDQNQDMEPGKLELNNTGVKKNLIQFVRRPVPLYQVAASILILLGLFFAYNHYQTPKPESMLALNNTIPMHKTDTIYLKITDTVRVVVEKLVYITPSVLDTSTSLMASNESKIAVTTELNCDKNLCPDDVEIIQSMGTNKATSLDSVLKGFVVSLN